MSEEFKGKVALVTGGSSGIGRASALAFAREGAKVAVCADKNIAGGEETVRLIQDIGGQAVFIKADISKSSDVHRMVERTVQTFGRLDFAHNNAGIIGPMLPTADWDEKDWRSVVEVDLIGTWLCMKYEIPEILRQGGGAIVNTSSIVGLVGAKGNCSAYAACKHGIVGMTRVAAVDYARQNIRINAVCAGTTLTPLVENYFRNDPQAREDALAIVPMGRACTTEEVASTVVWLCSDGASYITGHALAVDGGMVMA